MRKLMWFTIGFAAACGLCAYTLLVEWVIPLISAAALVLAILMGCTMRWKTFRPAAFACLGCILGFVWFLIFRGWYLQPAIRLDGVEREAAFTASDYGYETDYGSAVDGVLLLEDQYYQTRIYLDGKKEIAPGDQILGMFRFRVTTPDGQEESTYHQGKGIFLLAYQEGDVQIDSAEETPWWCFPSVLRQQINGVLQSCFPEDVAAFSKALLLGDGDDLSYETDTAFKLSGIRHIIAVSGLHISILYGLISFLTAKKRFLTAIVGIPVLLLFAAVAGFTPSVVRACIMVGLMMLATLFDREYDSPTELAFACLVMLVLNPLVITSVSFQLSVGCVAGILLFNTPIHKWMKDKFKNAGRLQNWLCSSVSVTLSAMSLTTPLSAYYFGAVSLVGAVTNLLTLWIVNLIFNGIIIVCLASLLSGSFSAIMGSILAWPIRYVLFMADILGELPFAAVYTRSSYITVWLVFCYCLLAFYLLVRRKRPLILGCCAATGLCLALLASWAEPLLDDTRVTVLDVGQGQSILLQSEGRTYLVDCGGDSDIKTADIVAETLLSQGVDHLDGILLTHYDRDHAGALSNLLTRIRTDLLLLPDTVNELTPPDIEGEILYVDETVSLSFGDAEITVYGPIYSGSSNENSLCVLFDTEKCDILITGDRSDFGERMLMRKTELPDVDLLIAGHHGSRYSTSEELLQTVQPEVVIISVGADNTYGHPAPELLERLEKYGCTVYRTDISGTIIYRR